MSYLYETHLHTSPVSACARSQGAEYVKVYQDLGYSGIFVTDHFFHGNCALDRNLPWKEWVKRFCAGYESARNEGERLGFDVFFAWEETVDFDDYLIYGLDKNWLLEHPEVRTWSRKEQYETISAAGGCLIQAHPFRQHDYISRMVLSTGLVDGVEVANAGNAYDSYDALAMRYGVLLGVPLTAGSDIHHVNQAYENRLFGIRLEEKLENSGDYVRAIKGKKNVSLCIPPGRCELKGGEDVKLPIEVRDKNDRSLGKSWREFMGL